MEPNTTGKRIVSKGEYVRLHIGHRTVQATSFVLLAIASTCFLALVGVVLCAVKFTDYNYHNHKILFVTSDNFAYLIWLFGMTTWVVGKYAVVVEKKAAHAPFVIVLSQDEIDALPALDSLVRASCEPPQAQEAVLLRAAAQGQETPPEQLVRPAREAE